MGRTLARGKQDRINRQLHQAPLYFRAPSQPEQPPVPAHRQFIAVTLGGAPLFFHNDGDRLVAGDKVQVTTKSGPRVGVVAEILERRPPFDTPAVTKAEAA